MSMLKPLEQWMCDVCDEVIDSPREGMVQWIRGPDPSTRVAHGFRIVHNAGFSPRRHAGKNCYYPEQEHYADGHLEWYLGAMGIVRMASFLDVGPYHVPTYGGPEVTDLREFAEIIRRLHVPYYEEARLYWGAAKEDGMFDDANELWVYDPKTSKRIIEKYGHL
jgi:hypothetical protein